MGKTWLVRSLDSSIPDAIYFNYDRIADRRMLIEASWPARTPFLVFDEIHKMPEWMNWLKGIFDTRPEGQNILVTGSARLETFRQSGDSTARRYLQHWLPHSGPDGCFISSDILGFYQSGFLVAYPPMVTNRQQSGLVYCIAMYLP